MILPEIASRKIANLVGVLILLSFTMVSCISIPNDSLKEDFKNPPDSSKPGVYWYFMDGNLSRAEMTKDLESMKQAGISNLVFLEIGIGVPPGPVDFMSEQWQDLVFSETEIEGNQKVDIELPIPEQRSTTWHKMNDPYYEDVAVYAVPSTAVPVIADINEKALYERDPYSSKPNVKPYLPALANYDEPERSKTLPAKPGKL